MLSIFNGFIVQFDISNLSFRARKKTLQSHGLQGFSLRAKDFRRFYRYIFLLCVSLF